jgi:hypothetical protein
MHMIRRKFIFRLTLLLLCLVLFDIEGQVPTNGLVGGWPFNGNALDVSGNGNHGTPYGATLANDRFNNSNCAYYFDGVNDFIQMLLAGPTGSVSRSLSFWMKSAQSGTMTAFSYGSDNGSDGLYEVFLSSWCISGIGFDNSQHHKLRYAPLFNNAWRHIVIVLDNTIGSNIMNLQLYIDGSLYTLTSACASSLSANIFTGNQFPVTVGRNSNNSLNFFTGYLDDLFLYDRVLTATEVQNLYNACGVLPSAPLLTTQGPTICPGTTITFSTPSVLGASSYVWYLPSGWTGSSISNTISLMTGTAGGVLGIAAMNGCGLSSTSTIQISVFSKVIFSVQSSSSQLCSGSPATLTASGGSTYTWSSGGGNFSSTVITPTATTMYIVNGLDTNGCASNGNYTQVVKPVPFVSINSGSVCQGNSFTLNPQGAQSYTISTGTTVLMPLMSTTYAVTGSSAGCISQPAVGQVIVIPTPVLQVFGILPIICASESVSLTVTGANLYIWSNGLVTASVVIQPTTTTQYSLTGINQVGCKGYTVITQNVSKCTSLPPDVFKPEWQVYPNPMDSYLNIEASADEMNIEIWDSVGRLVYSINKVSGVYNLSTQELPGGVYIVKLSTSTDMQTFRVIK